MKHKSIKYFFTFLFLLFITISGYSQKEFFRSKQIFTNEQMSNFYSSVTIHEGLVIFNANDYHLYVYKKKDGLLKWAIVEEIINAILHEMHINAPYPKEKMNQPYRFEDENLVISDFFNEVLVNARLVLKKLWLHTCITKKVRLFCVHCGYNKEASAEVAQHAFITKPANQFFDAELWLQIDFKKERFWAYNDKHLDYLERYISATLRGHKERTHFTLLEKLPKFYHEAKNREGLLKVIAKLKNKL